MYRFGTIAEGVWEKGVFSGTLTDGRPQTFLAKTGDFKHFELVNCGCKITMNETTK